MEAQVYTLQSLELQPCAQNSHELPGKGSARAAQRLWLCPPENIHPAGIYSSLLLAAFVIT